MSIYQIDLGLLKESEETYRESATELETYIAEATEEIGKVTEEVYAGDDADKLRDGISKHITGYFSDTKDMATKITQQLSLAQSWGRLCKKRCYDFIFALGGSGESKSSDSFTGMLYCDQDKITALKQTCITTMQYGDRLKSKANTVKGLLDMIQMVTIDSSGYVGRIKTSCDKIDHLEEYSLELTKYAEYVEKMDESLQTGLKECMPEDYVMTADGVDDRQKYLDMEYDINELEELLNTPEEELTDDLRAKRDILLLKQMEQEKLLQQGDVLLIPEPGETITISRGTDLPNQEVVVSSWHAWSIEYSIHTCNTHEELKDELCCRRLNYAVENYECNSTADDLLMFDLEGYNEPVFAGAMVEGYADIGDIVQVTLDDSNSFYFLILDVKSTKHTSEQLSERKQFQCGYGHGYMLGKDVGQLNICEFITAGNCAVESAVDAESGTFLKQRRVVKAKIVDNIEICD